MTIFSKIIAGEIPCFKVAENDKFLAFLDIFPSVKGHTLVVPKMEVDRLFDLPDDYLDGYLTFCKPIANAILKAFGADRVNIITLGFEVPHAHVHVVPLRSEADLNFANPKLQLEPAEFDEVAARLRRALSVATY
jgi:histidine triad (HIT) family protein